MKGGIEKLLKSLPTKKRPEPGIFMQNYLRPLKNN
jgi:hypothetical protein